MSHWTCTVQIALKVFKTGVCREATVPFLGKYSFFSPFFFGDTVDGRNPEQPVDMENLPLFTHFRTCQVVSQISLINSKTD